MQPQSLDRIREIETLKPVAPEGPAAVYPAPTIPNGVQAQGNLEEAGSVHLQAQYTPIDDPHITV